MLLTRKLVIGTGAFEELVDKAQVGDLIELYRGLQFEFASHRQGAVIEINGQLLLNGETVLDPGPMETWSSDHEGNIVVQFNRKLLLNDQELCNHFDHWGQHEKGIVVQQGDSLVSYRKAGHELLYQGNWDDWQSHPRGVVIKRGDELLLNGKEQLYKGPISAWQSCDHDHEEVMVAVGNQILLSGRVVYEGRWHRFDRYRTGVLVEKDNQVFLSDKNGVTKICESTADFPLGHPNGILFRTGNALCLYADK